WVENYGQGAILTWRTNLEMDLRGYNIYRSIDSLTQFTKQNVQPHPDTLWIDTLGTAWPRFYYVTAVDSTGNESAHSDTVVLGTVGVGDPVTYVPFTFQLEQNYPNPFNPSTQITFEIPIMTHVELTVFDVLGRKVATLVDETKRPGKYTVAWNATDQASGVYFMTLKAAGRAETKRMLLMK
ncbi:MAG: hypothetical protein HW412_1394, partial [Bacteroidetes bacterium]|nr:hypothetical protein [Bacteroidota bacterium]